MSTKFIKISKQVQLKSKWQAIKNPIKTMFCANFVVIKKLSRNTTTGKSFSEVLIYLSINPQYDNKLFNDLQVQYKKIPRAEDVKNMLFTQIVLNA